MKTKRFDFLTSNAGCACEIVQLFGLSALMEKMMAVLAFVGIAGSVHAANKFDACTPGTRSNRGFGALPPQLFWYAQF